MHAGSLHINYVSHQDIDKAKWDATIEHSPNGLIYAGSVFLDNMSPGWDALVAGDYDFIFPVTWRSKMGIQYVCQPAFIQQLGLFSKKEINTSILSEFLIRLSARFRLIEIFINYQNAMDDKVAHHNFILPLTSSYDDIASNFKQDLLKNLRRCAKYDMRYMAGENPSKAIELFRETYQQRLGAKPDDYTKFDNCIQQLMGQGNAFVRNVISPGGELLATGVFAKDQRRIYNLASTTLPNGRMMEANHFLFDQLIREFAGSGLILDFEGSDQPGIARFYQKFGANDEPYYFFKTNRLPAILRWWKR
jgi:hypothetical protein